MVEEIKYYNNKTIKACELLSCGTLKFNMKTYTLEIECDTLEIAQDIQQWVNRNFNSEEVYWNAIKD